MKQRTKSDQPFSKETTVLQKLKVTYAQIGSGPYQAAVMISCLRQISFHNSKPARTWMCELKREVRGTEWEKAIEIKPIAKSSSKFLNNYEAMIDCINRNEEGPIEDAMYEKRLEAVWLRREVEQNYDDAKVKKISGIYREIFEYENSLECGS